MLRGEIEIVKVGRGVNLQKSRGTIRISERGHKVSCRARERPNGM